jgi:hypothetical protein
LDPNFHHTYLTFLDSLESFGKLRNAPKEIDDVKNFKPFFSSNRFSSWMDLSISLLHLDHEGWEINQEAQGMMKLFGEW